MAFEEFYTREKANEGVKMPLYRPDGTKTDKWLLIRGSDSDEARSAYNAGMRKAREIAAIKDDAERMDASIKGEETARLDYLTALVAGWSEEEPCEPEAVRKLLSEAPQIADAINLFAGNRALFFAKGSSSSADT